MLENRPEFDKVVEQEVTRLRRVHPTPDDIPSCLNLFELVTSCHAIRSQVKSWYRYGEMSKCSHKHEDLKFCFSIKSMDQNKRYEAWIQRRAEWWAKRRLDKSSEDVWALRETPKVFPPAFTDQEIIDIKSHSTTMVL